MKLQDVLLKAMAKKISLGDGGREHRGDAPHDASAGKSSFCLRLCGELARRGFRRIRIRLRDVPLDMNIADALPRAVLLHDSDLPVEERGSQPQDDVFLRGNLFRESILHNGFLVRRLPMRELAGRWPLSNAPSPAGPALSRSS